MPKNKETKRADAFYQQALQILLDSKIDFLLGGAFAMHNYTEIYRDTKDLDIFCRPGDYTKILKHLSNQGFEIQLKDARWLAKALKEDHFIDIIFDNASNLCPVDDLWFQHARNGEFAGLKVRFVPAEEIIWSKLYVQNRERFDGADINHILLKYGKQLDWNRLLLRMDRHWHLLLAQLLNFQFVYPANYQDVVPQSLFEELLKRAREQYELPASQEQVCRGPVLDHAQYSVDIQEWDFKVTTT